MGLVPQCADLVGAQQSIDGHKGYNVYAVYNVSENCADQWDEILAESDFEADHHGYWYKSDPWIAVMPSRDGLSSVHFEASQRVDGVAVFEAGAET